MSLNPFEIRGTVLPPSVLLAAKLVVFAFLVNGGFAALPQPFVPFVSFLGDLPPAVFRTVLQGVWLIAAASLLMNRAVRLACGVLGAVVFLAELSSHLYRTNNLTFMAMLLILIALSDRKSVATVIRAQLVVLYFWAGLNKLLDVNWRSGAFFEAYSSIQNYGVVFRPLESFLPAGVLSLVMSWAVIATEFFLVVAFAVRRLVPAGILVVIAYHSSLLLILGTTFNMFWFALLAACLALTDWPTSGPNVEFGGRGARGRLTGALRSLDIGHGFNWRQGAGSGLRLQVAGRVFSGRDAFARVLFFHPTVYFIYFGVVAIMPSPLRWATALIALGAVLYVVIDALRAGPRARAGPA